MSVGLCPKCGSMVSYAKIDSIALRITGAEYKGISYFVSFVLCRFERFT